ncbi:MAG: GTPase [Phycisphaerales bacterium JB052]
MSERWHSILTPTQRAGAIAMVMLHHAAPESIGIKRVAPGKLALCDLLGIDEGVVLGLDDDTRVLMSHGGVAIVRAISERLAALGVPLNRQPDPSLVYPEAQGEIEACCLHALSIAPSPMAVDVLLKHSQRWSVSGIETIQQADAIDAIGPGALDRLLHPPSVVAVGRANVGKSSLINALVGQQVALVADVAGTTRDHVGVPVDLGGLVVRWIDTPGVDERIGDSGELTIARQVLRHADLVVHCIDAIDDPGVLDERLRDSIAPAVPVVRVGTRSDLGAHACPVDAMVQLGVNGSGLSALVSLLREQLLPDSVLSDPRPWCFWGSLRSES